MSTGQHWHPMCATTKNYTVALGFAHALTNMDETAARHAVLTHVATAELAILKDQKLSNGLPGLIGITNRWKAGDIDTIDLIIGVYGIRLCDGQCGQVFTEFVTDVAARKCEASGRYWAIGPMPRWAT